VDAGGKGLNVGKMLGILGAEVKVVALLGGETGRRISSLLKGERIDLIPLFLKEETRWVFNFVEEETGKVLRINEKGPRILPEEERELYKLLSSLPLTQKSFFLISGSIPPGLPVDTYRRIIEELRGRTKNIILDTDGEALVEGVKGLPLLIKPNLWELERLTGRRVNDFAQILKAGESLQERGIPYISLTLGEGGALLFTPERIFYGFLPPVPVKSPIGCGDAYLAGLIYKRWEGKEWKESLRFAVACGGAKAGMEGTAMPERDKVEELVERVEVVEGKEEVEMKSYTEYLWFNTSKREEFINITPRVEEAVRKSGVKEGLCLVNAMHITASVFINDDESGLHQDFMEWVERLAPYGKRYRHNLTGEDNADSHLKRTIMGREVVVAITEGRLDLGPWEQIFYGEFDGRRRKRVLIKIIGE